jgi:hypothetical protein
MLSIVWHVLVPGTHTVTLVRSMLRVPVMAAATVIGCVFGVVDCGTLALLVLAPEDDALAAAGALAVCGALAVAGALALAGALAAGAGVAAGVLPPPPPPPPHATSARAITGDASAIKVRIFMSASLVIEYRTPIHRPATRSQATRVR